MVFLRRRRKNPDYAFEKLTEEDIAFRRKSNRRILITVLCSVVALSIMAVLIYFNSVETSYETQNPKGELIVTLPEHKSEYEIYPTQEFTFDITAHYVIGKKVSQYGITDHDRCQIGMFFSDNTLCQRTSYDSIVLNEDVKVGTEFTVTLKFNDRISTVEFVVVEKPSEEQQNS